MRDNSPTSTVLARLLMASVFLVMGGYRLWMMANGQPTPGSVLVFSTLEVALGAWLASGWRLKAGALLAALVMLADALLSHRFWAVTGVERSTQLLHFMKNIGFVGGLLLLAFTAATGRKRRG